MCNLKSLIENMLIVVPARGGSKGLPGKNIKELAGRPLIEWSYAAAQAAGLGAATCLLSTEDEKIAAVGREVGLSVPFLRPEALSNDSATTIDLLNHALEWYVQDKGKDPSAILLLQPTSPLRQPETIREAVELLSGGKQAVVGVKAVQRNLSTLFYRDKEARLTAVAAGMATLPRQSFDTLYTPNGALYLVRTDIFRSAQSVFPDGAHTLIFDQVADLDIDDALDFAMIESIVKAGHAWRGILGSS